MKLLYAEDEKALSDAVSEILDFYKYTVDAVYNGEDALYYLENEKYDGAILDIMMPKMNGLEVLKEIRKKGINTPVLLLTAKSDIDDRILGLDLGADDYLVKPFNTGELLARVRAMLRRREEYTPNELKFGNASLNMQTFVLSSEKESITLSKTEYRILELFMLNKDIYISGEDILTKVWGYDTDTPLDTVWVYISTLRRRLSDTGANITIKAKRGIGYKLEETK